LFGWRAGPRSIAAYLPDWDVRNDDYPHTTLDLSHTAVSRTDAIVMATELGARLTHVHLADGTDSARDEHLIPGRGDQPVGEVLQLIAGSAFAGSVIVEVSTRRVPDRAEREADLVEALAFARQHLR
jgi:sugar phosphate isomerase/epimerase